MKKFLKFTKTSIVTNGPTFEEGKIYEFGSKEEFYTEESADRWLRRKVAIDVSGENIQVVAEEVIAEEEIAEEVTVEEVVIEEVVKPKSKAKNKTKVDNKTSKAENVL